MAIQGDVTIIHPVMMVRGESMSLLMQVAELTTSEEYSSANPPMLDEWIKLARALVDALS